MTYDSAQTDYPHVGNRFGCMWVIGLGGVIGHNVCDTSVESATNCLQNGISFVVCIRMKSKLWVFYNSRGEENAVKKMTITCIS